VRLHCVYRSTAFENNKRRPPYYSKDTALASFTQSLSRCQAVGDLVFLNDGPSLPPARLSRMHEAGEVIELSALGNGGSYRCALSLLETRSWAPDDIVYFAEDDYLYRPEAFAELVEAATVIDSASFFTLYDHTDYYTEPLQRTFQRFHRKRSWRVGAIDWRAARTTTMSFGARVGDMRAQSWIHFLGTTDVHPSDAYIWDASQSAVGRILIPIFFRCLNRRDTVTVNLKRCRRMVIDYNAQRRRLLLVAPRVSLATHMQEPFLAPNVDWAREAESAQ
jgi:hypothetical protein